MMKKIFAIGDIHGCLDKLEELIGKIPADPKKDQLVFLGDYIDRGRDSREVVDFVIALKENFQNIVYLMGNHERMFLNFLEGREEELYLYNGGGYTLQDYGIEAADSPEERKRKVPAGHLQFYHSLIPYYETEHYLFVHAGLMPGIEPGKQKIDDLVWVRRDFIDSVEDFGKVVVFAHTPAGAPFIAKNKIGIDTGAVYGGKLTCVELPALNFYQA